MKPGQTDTCPCGSGKKFSNCCHDNPDANFSTSNAPKGAAPTAMEIKRLVALFNSGNYAEAEGHSRALTEQYPASGFAWKILGAALGIQGKDSLVALQKAAELLPDDSEAHSNLGVTLKKFGRLDDAVASYHQALKFKPDYAEAHYNLGIALQELGRLDDAVSSYHQALKFKPDYAEAHYNLGKALKDLGRFDDAVASYHRALKFKPDYAEVHYSLGNALKMLGHLGEAVASYRLAQELKPDYA